MNGVGDIQPDCTAKDVADRMLVELNEPNPA